MDNIDKNKIVQQAFDLLKKQGGNTTEGLLQYLKERKLLDESTEKIAKQVMSGVSDPKNIDFKKFAEILGAVAKEKGLNVENITKTLAASLFGAGAAAAAGAAGAATSSTPASNNVDTFGKYDEDSDPHEVDVHHEPSVDHHGSEELSTSSEESIQSNDDHDSTD